MDERAAVLSVAHEHAARFLAGLPDRPVWPRATYAEMLAALGGPLPDVGQDPVRVVAELAERADPGLVAIPSGRFFGFVIGGSLPAALGADWLTSAWDQNAALSALTPAAAAAETVSAGWLLDLFGLPTDSGVGFVTGGMMANFTCLAAARRDVLVRAGWDLEARGLVGAPRVRVVVGRYRHDTVDRALRYLGFGRDDVVVVPTDGEGRVTGDGLAKTLGSVDGPLIVCLQAGEVHTGAFDAFAEAIPLAHEHGAWVHVDGAFGLWAAASAPTRHLTAGVAAADSWATDGHKTLNVPYDSGIAIVARAEAMRAVFGVHADYLVQSTADPMESTPEFSRRARGFPVWAALRSLGRSGVDALVAGLAANARRMADGLRALGAEVCNDVCFTQVIARFGDDAATEELGTRLLAEGTAVLTPGRWHDRAVLRCSVSNWSTTPDDVDRTLAAVGRLLRA
ncbi:MAG TPA: pyridoxal-dependent decarboxylase [Jatrophihabitantaceae bacterium]|jgi:glutamate/tyrosine decarboxylase-like PLP-dependent enzyme|nr:pyridoxal-dependent decarboxylase [Jatrophihabitantaceae bacterium]